MSLNIVAVSHGVSKLIIAGHLENHSTQVLSIQWHTWHTPAPDMDIRDCVTNVVLDFLPCCSPPVARCFLLL